MAPASKETSIQLCNRVTAQGNTISIRLLEYLSTAKQPILGVQALATEFIQLGRLLWSIEAGLAEASRTHHNVPVEVTQDLDKRIQQVYDEFVVLNQMIVKFVNNENHKSGFGKRFRMMFADTDVDKMRTTLSKSRDSLKVSSAMFRWTIGDVQADATMGIGYTGLIAALERMNPNKESLFPPPQPAPLSKLPPTPSKNSQHTQERSIPQPGRLAERPSLHDLRQTNSDSRIYPLDFHPTMSDTYLRQESVALSASERNNSMRAPSVRSSSTRRSNQDMYQPNRYHGENGFEDVMSEDSQRSRILYEDDIHNLSIHEESLNDSLHGLKVDSVLSNQSSSRRLESSRMSGRKSALVTAIEQRNHRLLAQLLDGGTKAEPIVEAAMLRTAIQYRDVESIALLLRYGADANGVDREGITPLTVSTQSSCFECAKTLLKYGADPNLSAGPNSESPLALAASQNHLEFVQLFMANGGDPNLIMENGTTALVQCMNKTISPKIVEVLLSAGANPDEKNNEGTTALFQAIQANRVDLMTILLDHGANPNLPGPKHPLWPSTYKPKALQLLLSRGADHKKTPGVMELAASLKKLESIQILIAAGVSPNLRKDGVYTPLCSAIRDNSAEIVTYLLANGADPNFKASEYPAFKCITHKRTHFLPQLVAAGANLHSPKGILETAVTFNDKESMYYLLDQGVNPNDRTVEGCTALTTAIRDNRPELVDILLARGADPAIRGQDWPLCMAVKQPTILKKLLASLPNPRAFRGVVEMAVVANQLESIKLLLAAGVSVEDKNCGVFSPLTTAIREERKDIVRYLLDVANADPNAPGEHLPLVKALRRYNGDTEIIQMLLTRGADINKMHRGWNPVLQAVENGDAKILKLLLDMGGTVDLQAIDESGKPVVDIVTERNWEEGLALLFPNATPTSQIKQ